MALKPSLSLKLGQQLRMTPQLQQAIKLLQLSTLDLQQEIQDALDSNLMLEEYDEQNEPSPEETEFSDDGIPDDMPTNEGEPLTNEQIDNDSGESNIDNAGETEEGVIADSLQQSESTGEDLSETGEQDAVDLIESSSLQEDLAVDSNWDDVFEPISMGSGAPVSDDYDPMESRTQSQTLAQHLLSQLELLDLSERDAFIAWHILDGLDAEGLLTIELDDILESAPADWLLEMDEIEAVLHLVQHLDPLGVAHRSLQECLLIQLQALPKTIGARELAIELINNHLPLLGTRDFATLTLSLIHI